MNAKVDVLTVEEIKLSDLQPDPMQPRKYFDEAALNDLAADIKVRGIIEPIIYFTDDKAKKVILAGERRYRAAKIAKLKTVPSLKREPGEPLERLVTQVSENFQREGLNAIEMAMFFERLITLGVKASEIGAKLKELAFKEFERSYISNIRRLLQLPEWTQQLIQNGKITAAHGKHLLVATSSDKVMSLMKVFLEKQDCTTKELESEIDEAFEEYYIDISQNYYYDTKSNNHTQIKFNTKTECKGCKTCQVIKHKHGGDDRYCLDQKCFDKKQSAAVKKIEAAEKRAATVAENKRKKALAAEANKQGVPVEELEKQQSTQTPASDNRAGNRIESTQKYLDNWLRTQIKIHLQEDEATRYQVLLWKACGALGDYGYSGQCGYGSPGSANIVIDDEDLEEKTEEQGINLTLLQKIDPIQLELMACTACIDHMSRHNLRTLAHHCSIELEGNFIIDKDYLSIKLKDEIIQSTPQTVIQAMTEETWEALCKKDKGYLIDNILYHDQLYGAPADMVKMYNEKEEF